MGRRVYTLAQAAPRVGYQINYEELLNAEQREVVMAAGGPMLVLAGAGTGKTRTLTYRVVRLLESGVPADRLLLLTFTNKAAREMMARVGSLLGEVPRGLWGGTFHHIGVMILRRHSEAIDYPSRFQILDEEDAESVMGMAVASSGVDTTKRLFPRPRMLVKLYSMGINTCEPSREVVLRMAPHLAELLEPIEAVLAAYVKLKREIGAMDFDDLLLQWHRLFEREPSIARLYADRFQHVLVDEYQDTNQLQGRLIDACARTHRNLMVVGDDCQSIFRFRGADYSNILDFPKRHAETRIFKLQTNYRSTPQVLALANRSIRYNRRQYHKTLSSVQPEDVLPAVVACKNVDQQAAFVAQRVLEIRDEGVPLNEIAVLYRAHYQSMELQLELTRRAIPYIVRSGVRFFEQAHIKDVLSYLRLVYNPADRLAFVRIMRTADGIGKKLTERLWGQLQHFDDPSEGWESDGIADGLPKRAARSWDRSRRLLSAMRRARYQRNNPAELTDMVMDGGYRAFVRKSYENFDNRISDLQQLSNFAAQYDDLERFLTEVALQGSVAAEDVVDGGELDEHLVLSSIHQAKGLEFRAVFVLWLSEGRFPVVRAEDPESIEEERRLFYVSVTRAKNELYLLHPLMARERERGMTLLRPSPFIEELGDDVYEEWVLAEA